MYKNRNKGTVKLLCLLMAMAIAAANLHSQGIANGLVAYYNFCDCKGTDISGNGNHATIEGRPLCIRGKLDRGILLNQNTGTNPCGRNGGDYIRLPSFGPIWANGFTVCAWAKFESPMSYERIIDMGNASGENGGLPVWFGREAASNNLTLESWVNTNPTNRTVGRLVAAGAVTNGSIEYYCATISGDTMRIFVNGVLVAEKKGHPILNVARNSNAIGRSNWCDDDFKGFMDEVRIYNRALSPAEIASLYQVTNVTDFEVTTDCGPSFSFSIPPSTLIDSVKWDYTLPDGNARPIGKGYQASLTVPDTGIYQVRAVVYKGCLNDTVVKQLPYYPSGGFLGPDVSFCEGTTLQLGVPAISQASYNWQNGFNGNSINISAGGRYWLTFQVGTCSFTDTVQTIMIDTLQPTLSITATNTAKCDPSQLRFEAASGGAGDNSVLQWLLNGSAMGVGTTTFSPAALPSFTKVSAILTSTSNCRASTVTAEYLVQYMVPAIALQPDTIILEGSQFVINAFYTNHSGSSYTWQPATALSSATAPNPVAAPIATTTYTVYTASAQGCRDSASFTVTVLPKIEVPNAFSPNGDGINDGWMIGGLQGYLEAHVQVFDRFGQPVFKSKGYPQPWDGKRNGAPLPVGVYYYLISLPRSPVAPITGSVTLLR